MSEAPGILGGVMPYSEKQRVVAAIAEHSPGKLFKRNRGMLSMSHTQLHDFASGSIKKKKKKTRLKDYLNG